MGLLDKLSNPKKGDKIRILIVEDEEAINNMYKMKLEQEGYEVYNAFNAKDGLELAESKSPALVLLDIMMPEVSGTEMLDKLRSKQWGANIRVIVLTNLGESEAPLDLKYLNVDRYIVKSDYTPSQVAAVVREVLGL